MSLVDNVSEYYAKRAPVYDETAGYTDPEAEELRVPIKVRYRRMFEGHRVLEIACGSGYWTGVVGETAESVLAIDINPSLVSIGMEKCRHLSNVKFRVADAYSLQGVPTGFTAAMGIWWWSHIPKGRVRPFLSTLHSKMIGGALVLFVDQLPYDGPVRREDREGNTIEQRSLPDGRTFEIVKNFPTGDEVRAVLDGIAENICYKERPEEKSWSVVYNTKE